MAGTGTDDHEVTLNLMLFGRIRSRSSSAGPGAAAGSRTASRGAEQLLGAAAGWEEEGNATQDSSVSVLSLVFSARLNPVS